MITKQDFIDSLTPWKPTKYIKARLKFLPYILIIALIAGFFGAISGILSFFIK